MTATQAAEMVTMSAHDIAEARIWAEDSFWDCPDDLSDALAVKAVERYYIGGVAQFVADGRP